MIVVFLWNLGADGVDQRVVKDAPLMDAAQRINHPTAARHPAILIRRGSAEHGFDQAGPLHRFELNAVELLASEVGRIDRVGVDQGGVDAGAAKHRCGKRAGKSAAGDDNVGLPARASPEMN